MTQQELCDRCVQLAEYLRRATVSSERHPFGVGGGAVLNPFVGSRNQLNKAAAELAASVGSEAPKDLILKSAKDLEGYIMVGKTTSVLPDEDADKALSELQDLQSAIKAM